MVSYRFQKIKKMAPGHRQNTYKNGMVNTATLNKEELLEK